MNLSIFLVLFTSVVFGKEIRMVQSDITFLGDITDAQANEAFDNPIIEKKHKVETLEVKVGDTIKFINRDEVAHNVSGSSKGKVLFDVKLQEPGAVNDRKIVLKEKGEITIQCAIHPKMKIKVKID